MKKLVSLLICILILSASVCAFAAPYTNETYQYSIEAPDGENIYYYTVESSNMPEDILAVAQSKTPAISFMTAAYNENKTLSYSVDISAVPLKDALNDPALSGVTDLSTLSADQLSILSQNKKVEYGADYTFDPDENSVLAGKAALVLTAHFAQSNGYTTRLYLLADNEQLFTITMLYKDDPANVYLDQASSVLNTLRFASTPVALQSTAAPSASASATPSPTPTASPLPTATLTPVPTASGFWDGIMGNITNAYNNDPYFSIYVIGGCVVVALIIILIVLFCARRRKDKEGVLANFNELEEKVIPRKAEESPADEAGPLSAKEEPLPEAESVRAAAKAKDPEYTQAPSPQATPPVRETIETSLPTPPRPTIAEEVLQQRPQDAGQPPRRRSTPAQPPLTNNDAGRPPEVPDQNASRSAADPSRPRVGSRMDRHKNKKKK